MSVPPGADDGAAFRKKNAPNRPPRVEKIAPAINMMEDPTSTRNAALDE